MRRPISRLFLPVATGLVALSGATAVFLCRGWDKEQPGLPKTTAAGKMSLDPRTLHELPETGRGILDLLASGERELTPEATARALAYIRNPRPASSPDEPEAEYFNTIIGILLAQQSMASELPETLLATTRNSTLSLTLRDYAMQHLYHAWVRSAEPSGKRAIEEELQATLATDDSPLQAVAILTTSRFFEPSVLERGPKGQKLVRLGATASGALESNALKLGVLTRENYVNTCLRVAESESSSSSARASSLHALEKLAVAKALPACRRLAYSKESPSQIVRAALPLISAFGEDSDRALLQSLSSHNRSVGAAASAALARLKHRNLNPKTSSKL